MIEYIKVRRDEMQVIEMQLSEQRVEHTRDRRLKLDAEKQCRKWRKQARTAEVALSEAVERARDVTRECRLAEHETRQVSLRNLSLQRKLSSLSECVPRVEHESVRSELESTVAAQTVRIQ